jgi:hypothetical protein
MRPRDDTWPDTAHRHEDTAHHHEDTAHHHDGKAHHHEDTAHHHEDTAHRHEAVSRSGCPENVHCTAPRRSDIPTLSCLEELVYAGPLRRGPPLRIGACRGALLRGGACTGSASAVSGATGRLAALLLASALAPHLLCQQLRHVRQQAVLPLVARRRRAPAATQPPAIQPAPPQDRHPPRPSSTRCSGRPFTKPRCTVLGCTRMY